MIPGFGCYTVAVQMHMSAWCGLHLLVLRYSCKGVHIGMLEDAELLASLTHVL